MANIDLAGVELPSQMPVLPVREFQTDVGEWQRQQAHLAALRQKLPRLVWQSAGICRSQSALEAAITSVESWQQDFAALPLSQFLLSLNTTEPARLQLPDVERQMRLWAETRNLLDVADLILKSAVFRTESRGGHYRLDYPEPEFDWQAHTLVQKNHWWKSQVLNS